MISIARALFPCTVTMSETGKLSLMLCSSWCVPNCSVILYELCPFAVSCSTVFPLAVPCTTHMSWVPVLCPPVPEYLITSPGCTFSCTWVPLLFLCPPVPGYLSCWCILMYLSTSPGWCVLVCTICCAGHISGWWDVGLTGLLGLNGTVQVFLSIQGTNCSKAPYHTSPLGPYTLQNVVQYSSMKGN